MRYEEFEQLALAYGSPFYIFDRDAFVANLRDLRSAFEAHYSKLVIGYSYKTNHLPDLCAIARDEGVYAEVVSRLELDLALKLGCASNQIIFNGPLKRDEDLELALGSGVMVNADSAREIDIIERYARKHADQQLGIGLRLNIPLVDEHGVSHLQGGVAVGRFGMSPQVLEDAARRVATMSNVRVVSLHGHVSSTSRSPWVYRMIVKALADAAEELFSDSIEFLNIGGGYFGRRVPAMGFSDTPTYNDYAEAVGAELREHGWIRERVPTLVIEPGMAVTADTMSFITRVFEVKELGGKRLAMVDGTLFNVKPTMHSRNQPFEIARSGASNGSRGSYTVVGSTCMEKDRLLEEIECDGIGRDDFIRIDNVGAYAHVLTPPFIQPAPAIIAPNGSGYDLVRRRQSFDDFYATYPMPESGEA
jgi:diaminopimelate decarboxylase